MVDQRTLLRLVGTVYEAALEPQRWEEFLRECGRTLHSACGSLMVHDLATQRGDMETWIGLDDGARRRYEEHFYSTNIWIARGRLLLQPGRVLLGEMIVSEAEFVRCEYYQDYLRPLGDLRHVAAALVLREGDAVSMVNFLRDRRLGAYDDAEQELLQALMPHLQRAMQMHRRLVEAKTERRRALETLDRLQIGVILTGQRGQVLHANRAADSILCEADGLASGPNGLVAARAPETNTLRRLVGEAAATSRGNGLGSGGALALWRPSGRRALSLLVTPLRGERSFLGRIEATVAVFVVDPEKDVTPPVEQLQRLHGLTAREARLAWLLLQGKTLAEASQMVGSSINTMRTHARGLFRKTGTRGQSDLIRLLLRSSPSVVPGPKH